MNFCSKNRLQQHLRTDHVNNGFQGDGMNISSNESKYPDTGHTASDEYQETVEQTHTENRKN